MQTISLHTLSNILIKTNSPTQNGASLEGWRTWYKSQGSCPITGTDRSLYERLEPPGIVAPSKFILQLLGVNFKIFHKKRNQKLPKPIPLKFLLLIPFYLPPNPQTTNTITSSHPCCPQLLRSMPLEPILL